MGRLTTHILDTASGMPGAAIHIRLFRIDDQTRVALGEFLSNADGRCAAPMLQDEQFVAGIYELEFSVGAYFAKRGVDLSDPPFLGQIVLRFGIADPTAHYHVPLLVSPYGYSTYRGS